MFETSLLESSPIVQARNRWPALASFAVQAVVVAALIAVPLLHPAVLSMTLPRIEVISPRFTPPPPPHIVQPERVRVVTASMATPAAAPTAAPVVQRASQSDAAMVDAPALAVGMNLGEVGPSPLSTLTGSAPRSTVVGVAPAVPAGRPLTISTGVFAGMLLAPIRPDYPAIARISHTEGTVVIEAVISKTGNIESAHVVSGPAMLQNAALQAVQSAHYRPFLLNNQPTEVETTININFRMNGDT